MPKLDGDSLRDGAGRRRRVFPVKGNMHCEPSNITHVLGFRNVGQPYTLGVGVTALSTLSDRETRIR